MYSEAIDRAEQHGIVFLDEIDKVAGRGNGSGPDVSREGVQRDILPIVEGSTVNTKYGPVKTDHVLFIAAGAFHVAKVSDLIPELQGRFPVRVDLKPLSVDDYKRILTQPENALIRQYQLLLGVDGVSLSFEESALDAIAECAWQDNETGENIGARRLHTLLERILTTSPSTPAAATPRRSRCASTPNTSRRCSAPTCTARTCASTSCKVRTGSETARRGNGPAGHARRRIPKYGPVPAARSSGHAGTGPLAFPRRSARADRRDPLPMRRLQSGLRPAT